MSGDRGDFLSRWSRRKLDARRDTGAAPTSEEVALPNPLDAKPDGLPSEPAPEGEAALTSEEIEALPKIEELTAETDIRGFLRSGVPELLKNAALRRMWSLDPAIRDYVSEAREYAYDWNVPGGVPGNGPLLPTDDVQAMLGRIFGDGPTPVEAGAEDPLPQPDGQGTPANIRLADEPPDEADPAAEERSAAPEIEAPDTGVAPSSADATQSTGAPRRRHGGAIPV